MKVRFFLTRFSLLLSATILSHSVLLVPPQAMAQEPKRWRDGDTLWYELDSLPPLPSDFRPIDTLRWHLPPHTVPYKPQQGLKGGYEAVKFPYHMPYWTIYRRSVTRWGITFSVGQPSPYAPYPSANALDAEVLSMPLNRPR